MIPISESGDLENNKEHGQMSENQYKWRGGFCLEVNALPSTIVIFGASGDLTGRKLLPSLYRLAKRRLLHERSRIIGCARTVMTDAEYRDYLREKWFSGLPESEAEEILRGTFEI